MSEISRRYGPSRAAINNHIKAHVTEHPELEHCKEVAVWSRERAMSIAVSPRGMAAALNLRSALQVAMGDMLDNLQAVQWFREGAQGDIMQLREQYTLDDMPTDDKTQKSLFDYASERFIKASELAERIDRDISEVVLKTKALKVLEDSGVGKSPEYERIKTAMAETAKRRAGDDE